MGIFKVGATDTRFRVTTASGGIAVYVSNMHDAIHAEGVLDRLDELRSEASALAFEAARDLVDLRADKELLHKVVSDQVDEIRELRALNEKQAEQLRVYADAHAKYAFELEASAIKADDTRKERDAMLANLSATQAVSTRQENELRGLRALLASTVPNGGRAFASGMTTDKVVMVNVLGDIVGERWAQDCKWGPIGEMDLAMPDGTGDTNPDDGDLRRHLRDVAQRACDEAAKDGTLTHRHILAEEFWEAMAEDDPKKLRNELIQVASVCAKWGECIDRRVVPTLTLTWSKVRDEACPPNKASVTWSYWTPGSIGRLVGSGDHP